MPAFGYAVVFISAAILILLSVLQYRRENVAAKLVIQLACIGIYCLAVVYLFGFRAGLVAKGANENDRLVVAVVLLYVFVVLGMLAESMFSWFSKTPAQRNEGFDWGTIIKPLAISPMVLTPTVAAFQNANIDLTNLGLPWLMIMLTAFEKGFLWKRFFTQTAGKPSAPRRGGNACQDLDLRFCSSRSLNCFRRSPLINTSSKAA